MIKISDITPIGIGTYRMTLGNIEHQKALKYALENRINLIDTASNYQFGNSEKLIGSILKENRKDQFIISKAGYISGPDIKEFSKFLENSRSIKINNNFFYSIEPNFIKKQIENSLKRLNTNYLDGFLIHNPEHYFDIENVNQIDIYAHLRETCSFLEEMVKKGIIRYYGVSSNTMPTNGINLRKILNNNKFANFKLAQFPYNLIENEAKKPQNNEDSLIQFCKKSNIITIANRPLNTTYNNQVLRLADYTDEYLNVEFEKEEILFKEFLNTIKNQLEKFGETSKPQDFTPISFFIKNRKKIANPEAVIKATNSYLIPFIKQLKFEEKNEIFSIIKKLTNFWILYSKKNITIRTKEIQKKLNLNEQKDISLTVCETYLKDGIDHVLVGMRKKNYVNKLSKLF